MFTGLFVVCAFVVLLGVGLLVAAVAILGGTVVRAFMPARRVATPSDAEVRARMSPQSAQGDIIDGEFSVVERSIPQGTR